ncbi:ABC transporter permease [Cellulosilyticum sp. I15G10I2]|uniref:ABC transporter permease n=1 Tax=Cellulosilyticum sp. I15G10I2 TaxID=1892843 RepID=UPI00085C0B7D|nr:ABC transporter permease [Cellulosilyticum sp. I15G10I2]
MRLAFKIAARFLHSSKAQTLLIVLGIAVGVSVQVFIGSLIQGLQKSLIDTTIGRSSHITISSENDDRKIKKWETLFEFIKNQNVDFKAVSVAADFPAFIKSGTKTLPVFVRGFIYEDADKIYQLNTSLIEGQKPKRAREVLIGIDLKNELQIALGDRITIITPQGSKTKVTITGVYDFKVASINESWLITDLKTAQDTFSFGDSITSVEIQINQVFKADTLAESLKDTLNNSDFTIDNWKAQNEQLLSGLKGQSMSSYLIQVFVMVSVILGIASVLAITVLQKSRQLGILKAMGIKDSTASQIFLFEGFILGGMGAVLGVCFGLVLAYTFTKFAVNTDGTPIIALYIDYAFVTFSAILALLAATLAALVPARRSAKISPIEVIKNG